MPSSKYKLLTEIPSTESLEDQNWMSDLNANVSKIMCKTLTNIVTPSKIGSVSIQTLLYSL